MPAQSLATTSPVARRLVTAKEAGSILGCSWRTVYRLSDSGKIPFGVKLGTLRRWDAAELESFIANGCKMPKSTTGRRA